MQTLVGFFHFNVSIRKTSKCIFKGFLCFPCFHVLRDASAVAILQRHVEINGESGIKVKLYVVMNYNQSEECQRKIGVLARVLVNVVCNVVSMSGVF